MTSGNANGGEGRTKRGTLYSLDTLERLWLELLPRLRKWLAQKNVPRDKAEDILSDCYVKLQKCSSHAGDSCHAPRPDCSYAEAPMPGIVIEGDPCAYLFTIVRNAFRDWVAAQKREWPSIAPDELERMSNGQGEVAGDTYENFLEAERQAAMRRVFELSKRAGEWLIQAGQLDISDWAMFVNCVQSIGMSVPKRISEYAAENHLPEADARLRFYNTAKKIHRFVTDLAEHDAQVRTDLELLDIPV